MLDRSVHSAQVKLSLRSAAKAPKTAPARRPVQDNSAQRDVYKTSSRPPMAVSATALSSSCGEVKTSGDCRLRRRRRHGKVSKAYNCTSTARMMKKARPINLQGSVPGQPHLIA
eukprot:TRINITY_DN75302_c0_g1_i1.p1 TRINITY_DN75302_c0_g1~~TRINITY_DN75302_c0_g1_i1.p1  ORF type:complete len:114 (+),score=13.82 TRINITY_DN75302_c0_g1_i1:659-1000(+)